MLYEKALSYQKPLKTFRPFPTIKERSFWRSLDSKLKAEIISAANALYPVSFPNLTQVLYDEYATIGNRANYEKLYFKKRGMLNTLVLAECVEHTGYYLPEIVKGIKFILSEPDWQIPAHNFWERPVLDLYALETAQSLACILYLFEDELDTNLKSNILKTLDEKMITPYLTRHFDWMGKPGQTLSNWTSWCTENALLTFLLLNPTANIRHQVILKATQSFDYFMDNYEQDGCCEEGAYYYKKASLSLATAIDALNQVTDNHFSFMYADPKYKNMINYTRVVHIPDQYYFNYGDCAAILDPMDVREYAAAKHTNNDLLMMQAIKDFKRTVDMASGHGSDLYHRLQNICAYDEIMHAPMTSIKPERHHYYESCGLSILHEDLFDLSVKAGHNGMSHGHIDTGSFILYKNHLPQIVDIGIETYSKQTFSKGRYDIWSIRSSYHNLPNLNGIEQMPGKDFYAYDVKIACDQSQYDISMQLENAYPKSSDILSFQRRLTIDADHTFYLWDHTVFQKNNSLVTSHFILAEKPVLLDALIRTPHLSIAILSPIIKIDVEEIPITDFRLKKSWQHPLYRLTITYQNADLKLAIK